MIRRSSERSLACTIHLYRPALRRSVNIVLADERRRGEAPTLSDRAPAGLTRRTRLAMWGAVALFLALVFRAPDALAQTQTAVCSNTPAAGDRISCAEDATSTNDIDRTLQGVTITTTDQDLRGISTEHEGTGDIEIDVGSASQESGGVVTETQSSITTSGSSAHGIYAKHTGTGDILITDSGSNIRAQGANSNGIHAEHRGTGKITVNVTDTTITTYNPTAMPSSGTGFGIQGTHSEGTATGDVTLTVRNATVTTSGRSKYGIYGYGAGWDQNGVSTNVVVDVRDSAVTTNGYNGFGIRAWRHNRTSAADPDAKGTGDVDIDVVNTTIDVTGDRVRGIDAYVTTVGNIDVFVKDSNITTGTGERTVGIRARLQDFTTDNVTTTGDIRVTVRGGTITTKGAASTVGNDDAGKARTASGIEITHEGASGDITVDVENARIRTEGTDVLTDQIGTLAHGIYAIDRGIGGIDIDVRGGSIETKGSHSYGIYGRHGFDNTHEGYGNIAIDTGDSNTIVTEGNNAHGIVAYHFGSAETRSIAVTVGGSVSASGAGAYGVGVGVVNADGAPERVATFDDDGYRRQTITVNGSATGNAAGIFLAGGGRVVIGPKGTVGATSGIAILATGNTPAAVKPRLRVDLNLDGRKVAEAIGDNWIVNDGGETTIAVNDVVLHNGATGATGRTAPNGAWNVRMRSEGVKVEDRTDPANWTVSQRAENVVADRDFSAGDFVETERAALMETFAPRAAVYEALPGFLTRLNERPGTGDAWMRSPGSPIRVRLEGGTGSYRPTGATVGARYDFDRLATEVMMDLRLDKDLIGSVGARSVSGSADIRSPVGGGRIEATGHGLAAGLRWHGPGGFYGDGRLSATWYGVDMKADGDGGSGSDIDAFVSVMDVEAGRAFAVNGTTELTARAWLQRSAMSMDRFTDSVAARVSVRDADRLKGGLGGTVKTHPAWNGVRQNLSLHGSLDLEQSLGSAHTAVLVSGTSLRSKAPGTRALLGLGATWRWDGFALRGEFRTDGPGSDDVAYSGGLKLLVAL